MKRKLRTLLVLSGTLILFSTSISAQKVNRDALTVFINQNLQQIGFSQNDLQNFRISDAYFDKASGATLVYLQQIFKGGDVYNAVQTLAIKNNSVASFAGRRIENIEAQTANLSIAPSVTATDAVKEALHNLNVTIPISLQALTSSSDKNIIEFGDAGVASNNIKSKLMWIPDSTRKKIVLSWQVAIQPKGSPDYWLVKVDASTGLVFGKDNLTVYCNWSSNKLNTTVSENIFNNKQAQKSNNNYSLTSATYRVIKFPAESPNHPGGEPALHTNPWELAPAGSNATTLKWNDDGTTVYDSTRGNNVLAQDDRNGNNGFGISPQSSQPEPNLLFDVMPDFTKSPSTPENLAFATTNLFYWNNIMHDLSYVYGFDEASGNFQANNLSRGGAGNDYVFADAQDGSGTNNANFSTPSDGQNGRMQMYLFLGNPGLDGDVDNGVIAHEYTHGISNRLTGGPSDVTCLSNDEQMGEGWSDYFALMATTDWSTALVTDGVKRRPIGTYVLGEDVNGAGIRTRPYSTNMSVNNLTYDFVRRQFFFDPHFVGEVWCEALWEMTWALIGTGGINTNIYNADGTGGNIVAMKLVMEGMKLQACSPGFIDGRDAILKADTLLYGGVHACTIWKAFTKRGLGQYASQGSPYSYKDGMEDFTDHNVATVVKTVDKTSVAQADQLQYTFTITAQCEPIINYKLTDTLPSNITYVSGGSYNAAKRIVTFSGININASSSATYTVIATANAGTYNPPIAHIDEEVLQSTISGDWKITSEAGNAVWQTSTRFSHSTPYSFYVNEYGHPDSATLTTSSSYQLTNISTLSFWHYYNTEGGYDGGWVEVSTDNGDTWKYVPPSAFILNGYDNNMLVGSNANRRAFSGVKSGFIQSIINLSAYSGKKVKIRFAFVCDEGTSFDGWYVDDVLLKSASGIINTAQLFNAGDTIVSNSSAISYITGEVLPVIWGSFSAVKQNNTGLLSWTTLQEFNTATFIIERSTDGINYIEVGRVAGKGNSSVQNTYSFIDKNPLEGDDQYRIRLIDKDGKASLSDIKMLTFSDLKKLITISPNPAKDWLTITITGNTGDVKIIILSQRGQQVFAFTMKGQYMQVHLPALASGGYYVMLTGNGINHIEKIVIQ